jgi:hypothetical protein
MRKHGHWTPTLVIALYYIIFFKIIMGVDVLVFVSVFRRLCDTTLVSSIKKTLPLMFCLETRSRIGCVVI